MTEDSCEAHLSVGAQTHSGIIHQSSLRDGCIAKAAGQFDRQRRSRPLTFFAVVDLFLFVNALVVSFKIVEPKNAVVEKREATRLIGYAVPFSRNHESKSNAVVVSADFEDIGDPALPVLERYARAAAIICGG